MRERVFCNPTCKNVLKSSKFIFENTIMEPKNKKYRKEGATSFCMSHLKNM